MRLVSFGDVTLPQQNAKQDLPVSMRSSVIPLRNGGYDQDGANVYLESKIIGWNFWVTANDGDIDDIIDNIYQESGKGIRLLVATMRDGTTQRQQWVKLVKASVSPDTRTYSPDSLSSTGYATMQVQFEMIYPYWENTADAGNLLDTGLLLDDGLSLDAGQVQTSFITSSPSVPSTASVTVANTGNVEMRKWRIVMYLSNTADISNLMIQNETTQETLWWYGAWTNAYDTLIIDMLEQSVLFNNVNDYGNIELPTNQINFPKLAIGNNTIGFSAYVTSGTVNIRVTWNDHFLR